MTHPQAVTPGLLACPFCGGDRARTIHIRDGRKVACICGACGKPEFHGPPDRPDAETRAITAWNTRLASASAPAGWIVGNNVGQWRTFDSFGWAWTDRRDLAVRYARREDAELVHGDDEDSWRVEMLTAVPQPPVVERSVELAAYDAGLLGDGGGGDVEWWQDYIRAELQRAHEFYADQVQS